jgi:hypothetical protein
MPLCGVNSFVLFFFEKMERAFEVQRNFILHTERKKCFKIGFVSITLKELYKKFNKVSTTTKFIVEK